MSRQSRWFIYARVSHKDSFLDGHSIPAQVQQGERYAEMALPDVDRGDARYGHVASGKPAPAGVFVDAAVSAYSSPLHKRHAGRALLDEVKKGDHIIFWKLDRGFRSVIDFAKLMPYLKKMGVTVHFVVERFNLGTAYGRLLANVAVAFAQFSSDITSERTRAALAVKRLKKNPDCAKPHVISKKPIRRIWEKSPEYEAYLRLNREDEKPVQKGSGKVYSYGRISMLDEDTRNSFGLDAQQAAADRYISYLLECVEYDLEQAEHFEDQSVSAYKKMFRTRKAGQQLDGLLQSGDHIVFARLDRAWRNVRDMLETVQDWKERGITVHFADQQIDTSTAIGMQFMQLMAVMAEWESREKSERVKAAAQYAISQGRMGNVVAVPLGFKIRSVGKKQTVVPDFYVLWLYRRMVQLRRAGHSTRAVSEEIERYDAQQEGRSMIRFTGQQKLDGKYAPVKWRRKNRMYFRRRWDDHANMLRHVRDWPKIEKVLHERGIDLDLYEPPTPAGSMREQELQEKHLTVAG